MSTTPLNITDLRRYNRNRIYRYLYRNTAQSMQSIARALQISLPTVSQNLRELEDAGLVLETGAFDSTGGRKAKAVIWNSEARFAVGLDVTRNHVGLVLLNTGGEIVMDRRIKCPFRHSPDYFSRVAGVLREFVDKVEIPPSRLLGVGIAVPAIVSENGQRLTYSPVLGTAGLVIDDFQKALGLPCVFVNDANAGGFAETWQADRTQELFVYLSLSNSVGGAIIHNNGICYGHNQRGGEFGHMTLVPDGRPCYCGQRGCVDAYCAAHLLSDTTDGNLAKFFHELKSGRPAQQAVWQEYVSHLTLTVSNLRMVFDGRVILGGYVGAYIGDLINDIRVPVANRNTFEPDGSYVHACAYRLEAAAVGAGLHYINELLEQI